MALLITVADTGLFWIKGYDEEKLPRVEMES